MKKKRKKYVKYVSESGSGHFYFFKKSKNDKYLLKKFDPIFKKHYFYKINK
ncbi:50S ribosomal protein L33 [Candidatus Vidania fulgoroideorum]